MMKYGKKLRMASSADGSDRRLMHWCPGCEEPHGIRVVGGPPVWAFDGNYDSPTFAPSILCYTTDPDTNQRETLCHYFIRSGMIEFCGDSPHKFKGQTVPLPDWPYAPGSYGGIEE